VRQLRLRDIGGIIVIDFIDMVLESNRELVLRRLIECLGRDRTKHQVAEVTSLGLVQMTRKRVGQGLLEVFSTSCESCNGRGIHVHMEPVDDKRRGDGGRGDSGRAGQTKDTKSSKDTKSGKADKPAKTSKAAKAEAADQGATSDEGAEPLADTGVGEADAKPAKRSRSRGRGRSSDANAADAPAADAPAAGASEPGSVSAASNSDASSAQPAAVPDTPEPAADRPGFVLAPRGVGAEVDLPPATTPKRKRRAASRPAGAPGGA
jgi:ribonuclease E